MKVCVIVDHKYLYQEFVELTRTNALKNITFEFYYSPDNERIASACQSDSFQPLNLREKDELFFSQYDLFLSLHSSQLFPAELVCNHTCINVHPGYNPYNRGVYPQVFSIINKQPAGVTIHRMDKELDHGPILFQERVEIYETDTSFDVYQRIQKLEVTMLRKYMPLILKGEYKETPMSEKGMIHSKKEFFNLCKIDRNKKATYGEVIDFLRAMTFNGYQNAYFITETGEKIYPKIILESENKACAKKEQKVANQVMKY